MNYHHYFHHLSKQQSYHCVIFITDFLSMSVCSTHYSEVTIKHTVLTNQRAHVKLSLKNTTRTLTINELKSRLTLIEGLYEIYVKFGIFAF